MKQFHSQSFDSLTRTWLLLAECGLSLSLLSLSLQAQTTAPAKEHKTEQTTEQKNDPKPEQKQGGEKPAVDPTGDSQTGIINDQAVTSGELPLLLLLVQRPAGVLAKKDEVNSALSLMLRSTLRESRRYQVILFSAEHPSIRRALLEHSIAASELVEPIKPGSIQKLATILGARHVLMVSSALDKVGMKTDLRLMEEAGTDIWVTPRSEPVTVDSLFGKIHLKTDQMVALTVDTIDSYLGIPSHLAGNIRISSLEAKQKVATSTKNGSNAPAKSGDDPATEPGDNTETTPPPVNENPATTFIDPQTSNDKTEKPEPKKATGKAIAKTTSKPVKKSAPSRAAIAKNSDAPDKKGTTEASTTGETGASTGGAQSGDQTATNGGTGAGPAIQTPEGAKPNGGNTAKSGPTRGNPANILSTDSGPMLLAEPKIVPPVPPTDRVNLESQADRYRKTGDMSNHIQSLRQAIDENPRDVRLRKKLIVAYQDHQLLDQAISETERALLIQPNDGDLTRIYASCLAAKGDTAGATRLLRDIVAVNPKDTASQVLLGDALLADSQFTDAYHAFEAAAANDPKSPLPHRRMARVLAARAGSEPMLYAECLQQIEEARKLTPSTDTQTYKGDYIDIMFLIEARLKDMLDQTNETLLGFNKRPIEDLKRTAADLNVRADAASIFLDKLPPAAGQETTHAHYGQAAALLVQAIGYLRKYLNTSDMPLVGSLRSARLDAQSEISTAHTRLVAVRTALEKGRAAVGESLNGN